MNDLFAQMHTLGERIPSQTEHLDSLEATKNALVLPFFQALGYDVFDTAEFLAAPGPELVGLPPPDAPDFAVLRNGSPLFLVECRKPDTPLLPIPATRTAGCFARANAPVVIYTNGIQFQVHTDLAQAGRLDLQPVMAFDLGSFKEEDAVLLPWLVKGNFDAEAFRKDAADITRYFPRLLERAEQELAAPSQELVRLLAGQVYQGPASPEIETEFSKLVRKAFKKIISDRIRERLILAISLDGPPEDRVAEVERMLSPTQNLDSAPMVRLLNPLPEEETGEDLPLEPEPTSSDGGRGLAWILGLVFLGAVGWWTWTWMKPPPPVAAQPAENPPAPATLASAPAVLAGQATGPAVSAPAEATAIKPKSAFLQKVEAGDLNGAVELGRERIQILDKNRWTLRLAIAFENRTVLNIVEGLPGQEESFFLLPIRMKDGRNCYQVFLGEYETEAAALARRTSLPAWFMNQGNTPIPFRIGALPEQQ